MYGLVVVVVMLLLLSYVVLCFNNCILLSLYDILYGWDMIYIFVVGLAQVKLFVKHEQTQTTNATELSFIIQFDSQL